MKDCFNLPIFKPSKAWLVGRINSPLFRKDSLLFKLFSTMDKALDVFRTDATTTMNSNCICSQFFNIKRKEHELGIPNSIFNNKDSHYYFDYTLDLIFGDAPDIDITEERKKDIYVASRLMGANDLENAINIGLVYCVNVEITQETFSVESGFTYDLPIVFEEDGTNPLSGFGSTCSFPYAFNLPFIDECKIYPYIDNNNEGKKTGTETTITIYTDNNVYFDKLEAIYRAITPIDVSLTIVRESEDLNPCLEEFIMCEE